MPDEAAPKSAYELAMERLKAQDRAEGRDGPRVLSDAQKDEISRLRQEARAKIAELEIMLRDRLAETGGDPEKIREVKEHHDVDTRRVESSLESAIARVRDGD